MPHQYLPIFAIVSLIGAMSQQSLGVYNADRGRWVTRDPSGYNDDTQLYRYAASNPVTLADSSGLAVTHPWSIAMAVYGLTPCPVCDETPEDTCLNNHLRSFINCPSASVLCSNNLGANDGSYINGGLILINSTIDCGEWGDTLNHETIHEIDDCRGNLTSCGEHFCSEIRAFYFIDCRNEPTEKARKKCAADHVMEQYPAEWSCGRSIAQQVGQSIFWVIDVCLDKDEHPYLKPPDCAGLTTQPGVNLVPSD